MLYRKPKLLNIRETRLDMYTDVCRKYKHMYYVCHPVKDFRFDRELFSIYFSQIFLTLTSKSMDISVLYCSVINSCSKFSSVQRKSYFTTKKKKKKKKGKRKRLA